MHGSKKLLLLSIGLFGLLIRAQAQDLGAASQHPFTMTGSMQLRGIYYNASGISARRDPYSYIFSGNLNPTIYGVMMPLNFTVSQQENSLSQPFNQFGISPHYKWITVHLGYRSISFSPYTLAGYTMLGAGFELHPGKFRAGFMYGRLNRATALDTSTQSLVPVSFTRKAFAARIGYGTDNNFIDLSILKGKDDASSAPVSKAQLDSLDVTPAANTVVALSTRLSFRKKLFIEGDAGTSIYTRDINSPVSLDSLDDAVIKKIRTVAIVNGTTELYTALSAAIGYKTRQYTIRLQYQRIDPDFKSMGAYFFNSDLESYSLAPSLRLLHNKLRVNGSIGWQHDNLQGQKESTTRRIIGTAMVSADFTSHLGLDLNYTNFSNNQQPRTIRLSDSLKIVQTTQNLSVSPRLVFANAVMSHTLVLAYNGMQLNDFNNYFAQNAISRNVSFQQVYLNYTIGFLPERLTVFANISAIATDAQGQHDDNQGLTLGASKTLFRNTLLCSATGGYFLGDKAGGKDNTVNASANLQYRFLKHHSVNALFFYTNDTPKNISQYMPAFSETRAELAYNYSF